MAKSIKKEELISFNQKANGEAPQKSSMEQKVPEAVLYNMIAEAAYYRAEKRGFQEGDPVEDWLAAEEEINEKLMEPAPSAIVLGLETAGDRPL
jgi:hypothetical protein